MLVSPSDNHRNRLIAYGVCVPLAIAGFGLALKYPIGLVLVPIAAGLFYLIRLQTKRRLKIMAAPFPESWEATLQTQVDYFGALSDERKTRFRNLVKVFLDEIQITGIRTEVDEPTRVLIAASAVIPIMGFEDFEYSRLGEVLVYPGSFDQQYQTDAGDHANTLGLVGTNHLSGVMILSKPSLIAGFQNSSDKRNVGIHEFAHLVDRADGEIDGIPPTITAETFDPWVRWVGEELKRDDVQTEHIDDYAYTNEAEYFAVLTEYFFESPKLLEKKNPKLYGMLRKMYHQDTKRLFSGRKPKRGRVGRNSPCPCGSGDKYKKCCLRKSRKGFPKSSA